MSTFGGSFYRKYFLFVLLCFVPASLCAEEISNEDCLSCHDDFEEKTFKASAHGGEDCLSCHEDITELPHQDTPSRVQCASCHDVEAAAHAGSIHGVIKGGTEPAASCKDCHGTHDVLAPSSRKSRIYHFNVSATCGSCHQKIAAQFEKSVHGKAVKKGVFEAPVCTDCHGEHNIKSHLDPKSRVYATSLSEKVCAQCHAAERITTKFNMPPDRMKTYFESYHGLAGKQGSTMVANCASCHGAHDILESSDPESSVHKKNLVQTCGKCHPGAGEGLMQGSVHLGPSPDKDRIIYYLTIFYTLFIVLVVGGMVLHNLLDFWRKLKEHYDQRKSVSTHLRFNTNERIQHAILFISFTVLGYTGFVLKFSDAWWARPLTAMDPSHQWRGGIHRFAAFIFTVLCVYHGGYLLFSGRGRRQLRSLMPAVRDWLNFVQMMRHNLGQPVKRPQMARYSYIEKMEYWALAWGSAVMVVTGAVLTFENISLRYLPKWVIDAATVVHYYEAILATLAIIVWHFYFTIFDPEHYPMNWSIMHGKSHEDRLDDESKPKDKPEGS